MLDEIISGAYGIKTCLLLLSHNELTHFEYSFNYKCVHTRITTTEITMISLNFL